MKIAFLFCLLVLCDLVYGQKDDKEITWSKTRKLTWDDFKNIDNDSTMIGEKAIIAPQFKTNVSGIDTLWGNVFVVLNKEMSMTIDTVSIDLLEHEQLHFDIAECFSRKMRQKFAELSEKGCTNFESFWKIKDSIHNEYVLFQNKYDSETGHGVLRVQQALWNEKVETMMNHLNEFELPEP